MGFCHFKMRVFLFESVRVDQSSFVSQKVFAIEVALWKSLSGFFLQNVLMVWLDGIPVLLMTLMEVVDGREVKILFMPAKNRLPSSNITIRIRNAFNEHGCCIL